MGQAQINVRTRACSRTSIARTRQAALTHNVRGKELSLLNVEHIRVHMFYCLNMQIRHMQMTYRVKKINGSNK